MAQPQSDYITLTGPGSHPVRFRKVLITGVRPALPNEFPDDPGINSVVQLGGATMAVHEAVQSVLARI